MGFYVFLVGILFLSGAYSMATIRYHHTLMGKKIREFEPYGYFHIREEIVKKSWPPSAPHLFIWIFAMIGVALLIFGIVAMIKFELIKPFLIGGINP